MSGKLGINIAHEYRCPSGVMENIGAGDSSCYEEDDQRCRNSTELRASWEHRGSNEGAPRESQGLEGWLGRKHGHVDYYLTQLLTGHGCFKYYLNRFKHERYPHCPLCESDNEDVEHVFFVCPRFENERRDLSIRVGRTPAACNLVDIMLESEVNWSAVCNMATIVLKKLRIAERLRNSNRIES